MAAADLVLKVELSDAQLIRLADLIALKVNQRQYNPYAPIGVPYWQQPPVVSYAKDTGRVGGTLWNSRVWDEVN